MKTKEKIDAIYEAFVNGKMSLSEKDNSPFYRFFSVKGSESVAPLIGRLCKELNDSDVRVESRVVVGSPAVLDAVSGAVRFKEGGLTGCRHGAELNYDPTIVANSSLFNEQWVGRIHRGQSETDRAIETIRFHAEQIETSQNAIDEAKALLLSKGVEYVGVNVELVEDMSDPKNWRRRDLLECIDAGLASLSIGEIYTIERVKSSVVEVKNNFGHIFGYVPDRFKFHSRPAQSK